MHWNNHPRLFIAWQVTWIFFFVDRQFPKHFADCHVNCCCRRKLERDNRRYLKWTVYVKETIAGVTFCANIKPQQGRLKTFDVKGTNHKNSLRRDQADHILLLAILNVHSQHLDLKSQDT